MAEPNLEDTKLIFGIDFGTTYSGVSWAWSGRPDTIHQVAKWPDSILPGNTERVKTPTVIHYPNTADGSAEEDAETTWGYAVPPGKNAIRWFKLLLLEEQDMERYLTPTTMAHLAEMRRTIEASGKSVLDITADYLRLLWHHTLERVESQHGASTVAKMPFTVVITVPAIWQGYVRTKMRAAVRKAGILDPRPTPDEAQKTLAPTTLSFISEPESAALATLTDLRRTGSIQLHDCITVVDFGGGTLDVISYQVTDDENFAVAEAVEGRGGLAGAIFLDQAFERFLAQKVGQQNWAQVPNDEKEQFLDTQWELGLKQLHTHGRKYTFHLSGTLVPVTGKTRMELTKDELLRFFTFSPVVYDAAALVKDQKQCVTEATGKPPKYIAMAGGFGASRFLRDEIANVVGSGTEILQGDHVQAWSAISRGAVMSAAKGRLTADTAEVTTRIARANYGFCVDSVWQEGVHGEQDQKYWHKLGCFYMARSQIKWFLKKGERTSQREPYRLPLLELWHASNGRPENFPNLTVYLYSYPDYEPPSRLGPSLTELPKFRFTAPGSFDDLPVYQNSDGVLVRRLSFEVHCICYGESLDVVAIADGKILRSQNYDIDDEADSQPPSLPSDSLSHSQSSPTPQHGCVLTSSILAQDGNRSPPPPSYTQTVESAMTSQPSLPIRQLPPSSIPGNTRRVT